MTNVVDRDALFTQSPPSLGNSFRDDTLLRSWLVRNLPENRRGELETELDELGERAGGPLYRLQLADRLNEPRLIQWDAWGNRIDEVEVSPLWREAERLAVAHGLVATGYAREHGRYARAAQFAKVYLFHPSSDVYTCPLAMTDGAARCLLQSGNSRLIDRALPRLLARDPAMFWTSGQWMTETTGGSDVGRSETTAVPDGEGWRLYGRKWFTSAVTSQMTLTLARPQGNPPGGKGLAMFYLEIRDADGRLNGIRVDRLKDKLGTRKVPTAELTIDGARAQLVGEPVNGTRAIEPMLAVTRMWNSVCAVAAMRRASALARSYALEREAFGRRLAELPLHRDTLAAVEAETWGAFLITFLLVELTGRLESGEIDDEQRALLRLVTPLTKLVTGKQAVSVVSEVIESFGGAGYVEDTGLPLLLRDTQVLPIWEGTTNVLALDFLRALEEVGGLQPLRELVAAAIAECRKSKLARAGQRAWDALGLAAEWHEEVRLRGDEVGLQAGARRFALHVGHAVELALACEHAQWALDTTGDRRPLEAARRLAVAGLATPARLKPGPTRRLALDTAAAGDDA